MTPSDTGSPLPRGRFITLEGGEGTGKTTLLKALAARVAPHVPEVVTTREPGGAPGSERIRDVLVTGAVDRWDPRAEALLLAAARREHVVRTIRPALARGAWVLCDRFGDSTRAYQGDGWGLEASDLAWLTAFACEDVTPDLTLILDLSTDLGLARAGRRADEDRSRDETAAPDGAEDRYERMDPAFHDRVRAGFLAIAQAEPGRCRVLDASRPAEVVADHAAALLWEGLGLPPGGRAPEADPRPESGA